MTNYVVDRWRLFGGLLLGDWEELFRAISGPAARAFLRSAVLVLRANLDHLEEELAAVLPSASKQWYYRERVIAANFSSYSCLSISPFAQRLFSISTAVSVRSPSVRL